MNSDELLIAAIKFLKDQTVSVDHGEVGVKLVVYGGQVSRIEKLVIEKEVK